MSTRKWRWTLALAVTISVAGNICYALMTATPAHAVIAAMAAAVAPMMLFLITHNLAGDRGGVRCWQQRVSLAGAWVITAMAFAASYIELHALMLLLGRSPASAILTPLIVDVAIAVASLRVLATDEPAAPSRTRTPSRWRRLADAATARAESAMSIPQVEPSAEHRGGSSGTVEAPSTEPVADATGEAGRGVRNPSAEGVAEVRESARGRSAKTSGKPRGVSAKGSVKHVADPALEPFMEQAQRLAEAGTVRGKAAADYARILWAVGEGWSPTRIKNKLGYAQGTTAKVIEAAGGGRPALTAV